MSEPIWCEVRQHYCRCHDWGERCDDIVDGGARNMLRAAVIGIGIGPAPRPAMPPAALDKSQENK